MSVVELRERDLHSWVGPQRVPKRRLVLTTRVRRPFLTCWAWKQKNTRLIPAVFDSSTLGKKVSIVNFQKLISVHFAHFIPRVHLYLDLRSREWVERCRVLTFPYVLSNIMVLITAASTAAPVGLLWTCAGPHRESDHAVIHHLLPRSRHLRKPQQH